MAYGKKRTDVHQQRITYIALGTVAALLTTILISGAVAWLVNRGHISESFIGNSGIVSWIISSAIGALVAKHGASKQFFLTCILTGGIYFTCLIGCTALFFDGQYSKLGIGLLTVLATCAVVGIFTGKEKKVHSGIRKKVAHR